MTEPHLIQDAIDRVVFMARQDAMRNAPIPTGEQIFTACLLGRIYGSDARNGDRSKMKRLYTSVRWAFEIHTRGESKV